jgi:transcriptional regulator with XRE-family HTH domain
MTITEAIRELRSLSGKSQQFFATELNMATRSLSLYESGRTPELKQLFAFAAAAHRAHRPDLYQLFVRAFNEQLEAPPGFYAILQFGPIEQSPLRKGKSK